MYYISSYKDVRWNQLDLEIRSWIIHLFSARCYRIIALFIGLFFNMDQSVVLKISQILFLVDPISNVHLRTVSNYLQEQDRRYSNPKVWPVLQSVKFPKIVKPVKKAHFQSQWTVKLFSNCVEFNRTIEIRWVVRSLTISLLVSKKPWKSVETILLWKQCCTYLRTVESWNLTYSSTS